MLVDIKQVPDEVIIGHAKFACAAPKLAQTPSGDGATIFWSCPVCGFASGGASREERPKLTKAQREALQPTLAFAPEFFAQKKRARR